ncbi:MAG TPA: septal ring lytic transglycosylase RlpA family protein [Thermoanaerobaculia bacterium]|nr:septal ring lytic transglycosylase RlpA family protein [Thermoanaerobaculia bacterium]
MDAPLFSPTRSRSAPGRRLPLPGRALLLPLAAALLLLAACTSTRRTLRPPGYGRPFEAGMASWYGKPFHGRRTASGERYDMHKLTAAHRTLLFGTRLEVRNPRTGRSVLVRVNDRGPFARNRILDLSYAAAKKLGLVAPGTAWVELYAAGGTQEPPLPHYTVQVAAFSEEGFAAELHRGLAVQYPEALLRSDGTWHRVQVGSFDDRGKADALRRELAILGFAPLVVEVP